MTRWFLTALIAAALVHCHAKRDQDSGALSVDSVRDDLSTLTADGSLSEADVDALFDSAGNRINPGEGKIIYQAVYEPSGYTVSADVLAYAETTALTRGLKPEEIEALDQRKSFAGSEVPPEVRKLLVKARLAGAVAYDVSQADPDNPDEGLWSPYPQALPAQRALAFSYTEITPASLKADMDDDTEQPRIAGSQDGAVTYVDDKCDGRRGNVASHYDELYHPNAFARGRSCQKWANNCALLIDGSLHCLPASRRMGHPAADGLILTNPSLGRNQHMLFNGHISITNGVVTRVGMSGRIAKKASRNRYVFIDPVPVLKAWGMEVASGVETFSEHFETASDFRRDEKTGTVRGPE